MKHNNMRTRMAIMAMFGVLSAEKERAVMDEHESQNPPTKYDLEAIEKAKSKRERKRLARIHNVERFAY